MVYADQIEDEYDASKIEVALKFVSFIEKEGVKAWHFLECLGFDAALQCADPILKTITHPDISHAISLIKCEGPKMIQCAPKLK